MRPRDLSVVFISFDEPEADGNFEALCHIVPDARRVHGVRGFDAAHVRAADIAETPYVITIDGDNRLIDEDFFDRPLEILGEDHISVLSFSARIRHNGLSYGNGGLKIWPRPLLQNLRTHERAIGISYPVDFVWRIPYVSAQGTPTESVVTSSPRQAYRAGFREGFRLAMTGGIPPQTAYPDLDLGKAFARHVTASNLERIRIWAVVGRDEPNGDWAMLGAREGLLAVSMGSVTSERIADFGKFETYWLEAVTPRVEQTGLEEALCQVRSELADVLGLALPELDGDASSFLKSVYRPIRRAGRILPRAGA